MGASQPQRSHPPPNDPSWLFPFYMSHLFLLVVPCVKQGLCQTPVNERECKWAKAQGQLTTASYSSRPSYVCLPIIQSVIIRCIYVGLSSVQFSRPVMSNSCDPVNHSTPGLPCSSPTPGVYSNSYPSSRWCHPAISSSVVPFSSCPQSLPASGSFPMSQLFTWGAQSTEVSASASVLPMNTQNWSPLGLTGLISLQSKGLSRVLSNTII